MSPEWVKHKKFDAGYEKMDLGVDNTIIDTKDALLIPGSYMSTMQKLTC